MGAAAVKPSALVARLLRKRRRERKLTLVEVSELTAARGDRIPTSTLVRIEQGKLDPGVRRLQYLMDLYQVPPHLVRDLVELESSAVDPPEETDLARLYERGVEHWKRGDVGQGLAHLIALREQVPADENGRVLRQKGTLAFAVCARNLGKYKLAKQLVDDLLCEPPDAGVLPQVLVLCSSIWRGLGSLAMARAAIGEARRMLRPGDPRTAALVLHQAAKLHLESHDPQAARADLDAAIKGYRATKDRYGEARALLLSVRLLEEAGRLADAIREARKVIRKAGRESLQRIESHGLIELGRLLARDRDPRGAFEAIREGLGHAVRIDDRNAQFFAHYNLWKVHESLGEQDAARFERQASEHFARFVDDHGPEVDEVRARLAEERPGRTGRRARRSRGDAARGGGLPSDRP